MKKRYLIGLDEGTTSARTVIFDKIKNQIIYMKRSKFTQHYPKPGWVEHDAEEIWNVLKETLTTALEETKIQASEIFSIGITNQRETVVAWDKTNGKPICPAIVWQCRRTSDTCKKMNFAKKQLIKSKTGLIVDSYFSATKMKWILDNVPTAKKLLKENNLCMGTVDSFITFKLTNGEKFVTDTSNASRTMLFNINNLNWDDQLLEMFKIPRKVLPEIVSSSGEIGNAYTSIGTIPICSIIGDQQASLFGQGCFSEGTAKNTYGTGCFILMNTGTKPKYCKNLLTTVAWSMQEKTCYALEGSVFNAGASIEWLYNNMQIIEKSSQTDEIAKSVNSTDGVYFVPAFTGLGSPYWDSYARGTLIGLTQGTSKAHIVRAVLESMAYNTLDIINEMEKNKIKINELRCDGGVSNNEFLMQFQCDMLNKKIVRQPSIEATVLGSIYLAGLASGAYKSLEEIESKIKFSKVYSPKIKPSERKVLYAGWKKAISRSLNWLKQ